MIGAHIKLVMEYSTVVRVPHYNEQSHHDYRRRDEKPQKQPSSIGDGMQRPRGDVNAAQRSACNKCSRLIWPHIA